MKNLFKKIASVVITAAMVSTSLVIPAMAEETAPTDADKTWRVLNRGENNNNKINGKPIGLQRYTSNDTDVETGIGEKLSDDKSLKLEQASEHVIKDDGTYNTGNFKLMCYYDYSNDANDVYLADSNKKYAVIGCDFYLDDENINSFRVDRESGYTMADRYSLADVSRQTWHSVYAILDMSDIANGNVEYTYYIDGEKVKNGVKKQYDGGDKFPTQLRLVFDNNSITQAQCAAGYSLKMHMDNIEYYVTDLNPEVPTAEYENNFDSQAIGTCGFEAIKSRSYEKGVAGKQPQDASVKVISAASGNQILYYRQVYPQASYTKFEFAFIPSENFTEMHFQSGWTRDIPNTSITADMLKDGWNKITYVMHDFDGKRDAATATSNVKKTEYYIYVNGELVSIVENEQTLQSGNSANPYDSRVKFSFAAEDDVFYVDDFSFTQSALPPVIDGTVLPAPKPTISADQNFDAESMAPISLDGSIGTPEYTAGVAGKDADDKSLKLVSLTKQSSYIQYQAIPAYAVAATIELNFMPNNTDFDYFRIGTRYSAGLVDITADKLTVDRWNNIKFVVKSADTSKTATGDSVPCKIDTYINGELVDSGRGGNAILSDINKYLIRFISYAKNKETLANPYFDDIKIKTYNSIDDISLSTVPTLSAVDTDKVTVSGKTISAKANLTAADFTTSGNNVSFKAYTDGTFTTEASTIEDGAVIVLQDADKNIAYYDVTVEEPAKATVTAGAVSTAVNDKDESDKAAYFVATVSNPAQVALPSNEVGFNLLVDGAKKGLTKTIANVDAAETKFGVVISYTGDAKAVSVEECGFVVR